MWASLGNITFQIAGAPQSMKSTRAESYAEHKLVGAKPLLQSVGDALAEIELKIFLHLMFTADVGASLQALNTAMTAKSPLAFVLGNGTHLGKFVIESIESQPLAALADGTLIAASAAIKLREWVSTASPQTSSPSKPKPAAPPPAIVDIVPSTSAATGAARSSGLVETVVQPDGTVSFVNSLTGETIKTLPPPAGATATLTTVTPSTPTAPASGVSVSDALRMGG